MRTNIVLNDHLVVEAFKYAENIKTKKDLIEMAIKEFIKIKKIKDIRDLRGKIQFCKDYDYKKMRI